MKNRLFYIKIALALCMVSLLASCRQELCYDHYPAASVFLEWEHAWERDYGMGHASQWDEAAYGHAYQSFMPGMPEWVALMYYDNNASSANDYYLETAGGEIVLPDHNAGGSMLLYNGDTEFVVFTDIASLTNARASATPRSRSSISYIESKLPGARSTNSPDALYAAFVPDVPRIEFHEHRPIHARMQPLVYTYLIRYEFEYGLQYVVLGRGALGGMAESVYLRNGVTSDEKSIILFDCNKKEYGFEAEVRSFGLPGFPDSYYGRGPLNMENKEITLNLELRLINGTTVEFNYDITDQLATQPRGGVITVKGIRIDDSGGISDSGFNVDITDWGSSQDIFIPVEPDKTE